MNPAHSFADGGPAFPCETVTPLGNGAAHTHRDGGMSLRTYYMARAMQALITAAWTAPEPATHSFHAWEAEQPPGSNASFDDWIARKAADHAEAMLRLYADYECQPEGTQPVAGAAT